jgi:hypothetical protein
MSHLMARARRKELQRPAVPVDSLGVVAAGGQRAGASSEGGKAPNEITDSTEV